MVHSLYVERMRNTAGVIFPGLLENKQDVVYTDGCYYFDPETATILANVSTVLLPNRDCWTRIISHTALTNKPRSTPLYILNAIWKHGQIFSSSKTLTLTLHMILMQFHPIRIIKDVS